MHPSKRVRKSQGDDPPFSESVVPDTAQLMKAVGVSQEILDLITRCIKLNSDGSSEGGVDTLPAMESATASTSKPHEAEGNPLTQGPDEKLFDQLGQPLLVDANGMLMLYTSIFPGGAFNHRSRRPKVGMSIIRLNKSAWPKGARRDTRQVQPVVSSSNGTNTCEITSSNKERLESKPRSHQNESSTGRLVDETMNHLHPKYQEMIRIEIQQVLGKYLQMPIP